MPFLALNDVYLIRFSYSKGPYWIAKSAKYPGTSTLVLFLIIVIFKKCELKKKNHLMKPLIYN